MATALFDWEWEFILEIIYRLNALKDVTQFQKICLEQLRVLIPNTKAMFLLDDRRKEQIIYHSPVHIDTDYSTFNEQLIRDNVSCRTCQEYYFGQWSHAFRRSDVEPCSAWEQSPLYKKVYEPQNIYHALKIVLIYDDCLLGDISLYRPKDGADFSVRDLNIVTQLQDNLALKLFQLRYETLQVGKSPPKYAGFMFTRREIEVLDLLHAGETDKDICKHLFIAPTTLKKHIHSIYHKTGAKSRVQIMLLTKQET
jgi:DNA-binding CsgD family transcriptional regulator